MRSPNISNVSDSKQSKESRKVKLTISKNIKNLSTEKRMNESQEYSSYYWTKDVYKFICYQK